ncbi:hypothetical protein D3C76_1354430 [compost metagenome]
MFSDACGQFVPKFELRPQAQPCQFYPEHDLFAVSRNQVSLLCAASEGQLAYEGTDSEGSNLKFGRFTQTCLKGLSGSSARYSRTRWVVIAATCKAISNRYDVFTLNTGGIRNLSTLILPLRKVTRYPSSFRKILSYP